MFNVQSTPFTNHGFVICKLTDDDLLEIKQEVDSIQSDFGSADPYNQNLLGNIEHEYKLNSCIPKFETLCNDLIKKYYGWNGGQLYMPGAWVNFQKKYEFNPPHYHDGDFVSVIWLKIPYTRQQELDSSRVLPDRNLAGYFSFLYVDTMGKINQTSLPLDEDYENAMVIFPAHTFHMVYPFYTSDDYRISVSGNLYYKR
jgi:hypothetical protein